MLTAIRQWVIKTMMKGNTGVVRTLPKREIIEMNVQITAQRLMQNGINPNDMKTVGQVENVVNQIEQPKVNVNPGVTGVKKADVLDMEGNKIPEGSKIMGGKEVPISIDQENFLQRVNKAVQENRNSKNFFEDRKSKELIEEEIKAKILSSNKKSIDSLREKNYQDAIKKEQAKADADPDYIMEVFDPEDFATGGRVGLLAGSVPKIPAMISALLKNKKKVNQAVNNIFPTGDYKLDAEMVAESIVELNPKTFNNMLYDDLNDVTRSEVYGAALSGVNQQNALMLQIKKATRPEKTLQSMKEGKGINMSDPDIADEFARFMKETDPKGTKELEQKLQLENFKTKDRSENADGGRIGLKGGLGKAFLEFLKKFRVKQSGDGVKDFISKRQFMKDAVGNTEKNKKARELKMLKEAMEEARKNPGFKFKEVDIEKDIRPIFDQSKDRTLNADGGRIGLKGGLGKAFIEFLKNTGKTMNNKNPIDLGKDYLKYIKDESIKGNSKAIAPGVFTIGAGGILANRFVGKKLEAMNKEQKEENLKRFIIELENDEFYQKYPDLKDETIASYTEKLFGEKKADGGRIGFFKGAQADTKEGKAMSPGTDASGGFRGGGGDGPSGPPPPRGTNDGGITKIKLEKPTRFNDSDFMKFDKKTLMSLGLVNPEEENMQLAKVFNTKEDLIGLGAAKDSFFDTLTPKGEALEKFRKNATSMNNPTGTFQEYKGLGAESQLDTLIGKGNKNATENEAVIRDALEKGFLENESDFINQKPLKKAFADGGRIGLKGGMTKRAFLKLMGTGAAGIAAVKSGILGIGKGAGKQVAKEVVQQTTSSMPPPYFFKLAEKIKNMGTDVTATTERTIAKSLKSKDGNAEYILEQDMVSGDTLIKKVNKEGDDMITDVQIMEYRMGENVKTKDGRVVTSPNEYEEVTEVNKRIYKDDYNASDYTDGIEEIELKKIIDEVDDQAPSIKYASGGLAYMLGE